MDVEQNYIPPNHPDLVTSISRNYSPGALSIRPKNLVCRLKFEISSDEWNSIFQNFLKT